MNAVVSSFWIVGRFSTFTEYFGASTLSLIDDENSWCRKMCQHVKGAFTCCYRRVAAAVESDQKSEVEYVELQGLNSALSEKDPNRDSVSSLSSLEDDRRRRDKFVQR